MLWKSWIISEIQHIKKFIEIYISLVDEIVVNIETIKVLRLEICTKAPSQVLQNPNTKSEQRFIVIFIVYNFILIFTSSIFQ